MTTENHDAPSAADSDWVKRQYAEARAAPKPRPPTLTPRGVLKAVGTVFGEHRKRIDDLEAEVAALRDMLEQQRQVPPLRVVGE